MGIESLQLTAASPHRLQYLLSDAAGGSLIRTRGQILEDNGSGRGDAASGPLRALLANTPDWSTLWPLPPVYPLPVVPPPLMAPRPQIWVNITSITGNVPMPGVVFNMDDFTVTPVGDASEQYMLEIEFRHSQII